MQPAHNKLFSLDEPRHEIVYWSSQRQVQVIGNNAAGAQQAVFT
jgi:hypothetical protein